MPDVTFSSKGADKIVADSARINKAIVADANQSAGAFTTFVQKTSAANVQAATNWERVASGIISRNMTAEQKYQSQLAKVQTIFDQNKISAATYETEVTRIGDQYEAAKGKAEGFSDATSDSLTGTALTDIVGYATKFGSITAIIGTATAALPEFAAERERFAEELKGVLPVVNGPGSGRRVVPALRFLIER